MQLARIRILTSAIMIAAMIGCSLFTQMLVGASTEPEQTSKILVKETIQAHVLLNPVILGDHKDDYLDWDNWNDTRATLLHTLEGNVSADIAVKYDDKDVYVRVKSVNDKTINSGDDCRLWFDPLHNGTSKLPQTDDLWIGLFWVGERFGCNIARGTGLDWTSWTDKLPDGRDLVRDRLSDSYVSLIHGCVIYEFKLPRSLVSGSSLTIGFGAYVADMPLEYFGGVPPRYRGGTAAWPEGFGDNQTKKNEWPLNNLGILHFTGVPIPELGPSALMMLSGVILTMVTSVVRTRRRKTRVCCRGAFATWSCSR